jgi:hypothetical protein
MKAGTEFFRKALCVFLVLNRMIPQASAQKENNLWYFGEKVILDFNNGFPLQILAPNNMSAGEGCASVADKEGKLLFYTDGRTVWNRLDMQMPNGKGLRGDFSATQAALVVEQPSVPGTYYLFTTSSPDLGGAQGVHYNVIDMSLDGGRGDVMIKNVYLTGTSTEKVSAVGHANGTDVWIVTHNGTGFCSYLLSSAGLNATPVFTPAPDYDMEGYLQFSPDGSLLACANHRYSLVLYDFDKATGVPAYKDKVSFGSWTGVYGVEFSPDGSKLYVGNLAYTGMGRIMQFDLNAGKLDTSLMHQVVTNINTGALRLGPDNRIYCAGRWEALGVIEYPNLAGAACSYIHEGVSITGWNIYMVAGYMGLPSRNIIPYGNAVVPAGLTFFRARKEDNKVVLSWQENEGYSVPENQLRIQRSTDGISFETIASIRDKASFTYTDTGLPSSPVLYYRLAAVGKEGRLLCSAIRSVNIGGSNAMVRIASHPVRKGDPVRIYHSVPDKDPAMLRIVDSGGQERYTGRIAGEGILAVDTQGFVPGVYFIHIHSASGAEVKKLMLTH